MPIPASDVEALFDLIETTAQTLREKNPKHELLKFVDSVLTKTPWTQDLSEEFLKKFDPDSKMTAVTVRVEYYKALKAANEPVPG